MRQFFVDDDAAYRYLEERARTSCIRFRGMEMPPGCVPNRADIGFEVSGQPETVHLFVARGIQYEGGDPSVSEWLERGARNFTTFSALKSWIRGPLYQAYTRSTNAGALSGEHSQEVDGQHQITNMDIVQEGIRNIHQPIYLSEDALATHLSKKILGQHDALHSLAAVMVRHLARQKPTRPAVIFAVGPSGVGKTRTAEALPQALRELTPDENSTGFQFLRLDMTEYQEAHRVSQLLGSPQGYIGHGDGSQFADVLRVNPKTIVLFDEIEKAHPAILRLLMNAMDAGRFSVANNSNSGWEIDCRHAVFMFTSNLDAQGILKELEKRSAFGNRAIEDEVCRQSLHASRIPPEIIGRIVRFLVFRPLDPETRAAIAALAIVEVAEEYGVHVVYIEPQVVIDVLQRSSSSRYGVRPDRFVIDELLGEAFARAAAQGMYTQITVSGHPYTCTIKENS